MAGVLQPIHKMNRAGELLANVMPTRWAFQSLLLMEVKERPKRVPPTIPGMPAVKASGKKDKTSSKQQPRDMAELSFPEESRKEASVGVSAWR